MTEPDYPFHLWEWLKKQVEVLARDADGQVHYFDEIDMFRLQHFSGERSLSNPRYAYFNVDPLAEDFNDVYLVVNWLDISEELKQKLLKLDQFLDFKSGKQDPEFWTFKGLYEHPDWETVRDLARSCLELMTVPAKEFPGRIPQE